MARRIVITGLGALSPIGSNVEENWNSCISGKSGIEIINSEWANNLNSKIAGLIKIDPLEKLDKIQARRMDRSSQLGVIAVREAWNDAGKPEINPERLGVFFGSGIGGLSTVLEQYEVLKQRGPDRVNPMTVPMIMPNSAAAMVGLEIGAQAGVHSPVSACATSAEAIAGGYEMIKNNQADIVVTGGSEACVVQLAIAAFSSMRALSTNNEQPHKASRPYDKSRDGFVMSEGSAALVLEEEQHALKRGATIYGVVAGAGMSSDGYHIAAPEPEGKGAARAITKALINAGIKSSDVSHINAHATSTPVGDIAESKAMNLALGKDIENIIVSATKSMTGHLLGGAGALESIFSVLALKYGKAPGTLNLDNKDELINLKVFKETQNLDSNAKYALNNSFGFGGHNVCVVFAKN